jgi:hypothetical protein
MGMRYRIIHCKEYNDQREVKDIWWEVQCFKSKWWSFGERWFTEMQAFWSSGGEFNVPMRFESEERAGVYIDKALNNVPKHTIIREPVAGTERS